MSTLLPEKLRQANDFSEPIRFTVGVMQSSTHTVRASALALRKRVGLFEVSDAA